MNVKLASIGKSLLWFISALVFLAQGYRAVAYYVFDKHIDWNWIDLVVFGMAFMAMFAPSRLKTLVVSTATRVANKN